MDNQHKRSKFFEANLDLSFISDWLFFGKDGVITDNDPVEQEKRLKYLLDLVASAVIFSQDIIDEYTEIFLISFYKEYTWKNTFIYSIQGEYPKSFLIINS